ncbi:MAG: acyltransferase family protein [Deltaproteobacteria bacterium]|nr:acyltransferase family protein [Deltaproteobacteria bacterium]
MDPTMLDRAMTAFHFLSAYHKHEVVGIENIPRQGPAIIVINHTLATYDAFLLAGSIYQHTGRVCRSLGDKAIFQTPVISKLALKLGMIQGSPSAGLQLLKEGHLLIISPGGMRESLRPEKKRYQILWQDRMGFIRLALGAQVPIILAACPLADNLYSVYENPLTSFVYRRFKFPIPIARGLGPTIIPRPIALKHYVRSAISPPPGPEHMNDTLTHFHGQVIEEMQKLIAFGLAHTPALQPKEVTLPL